MHTGMGNGQVRSIDCKSVIQNNIKVQDAGPESNFIGTFYIVLIVLVVIDFFIPKHPHFPCEEYPSFYGAFGFVGCVGLVLVAKYILRPVVKRKENYYD